MTDRPTGAENITWNLEDLFASEKEVTSSLDTCLEKAEAFQEEFRGKLGLLDTDGFRRALDQLAQIQDIGGRAYTYAYLHWSTNTADPARGALLQKVREKYTAISTHLLFFDLEWIHLENKKAEAVLHDKLFADARHHLELLRLQKPHVLSEPEEKIMVEKSNTGRSAWNRYFDETLGDMRFDVDGEALTQQQVLALVHDADREKRRKAAEGFTQGLKAELRPLTYIFNTILADKALDDRLRGWPSWISSRNVSNEVADRDVEALIGAVTGGFKHVQRFYRLKKKMLGLDKMMEYDRYAPIGEADRFIPWEEARELVTRSYARFDEGVGRIVDEFFEKQWIDAALGDSKRGGAFSHGAVPSAHPYILLNYTGKIRDVQTLAHELGHGVHQYLSREQGIFHADTPLTTAETASVFGEMLVFQELMLGETDPANRLAMLMSKIDDTIATVFRQVSMNRFEDRIHTLRRSEGELTSEQFSEVWMETQRPMFGDSVTLSDNYRCWWSYIPHFLHTPGYVYAYAFGELLVLSLHALYMERGAEFVPQYVELLRSGGSDWPHELVGKLGVDLRDAAFWSAGIDAIGVLVDQAEKLQTTVAG